MSDRNPKVEVLETEDGRYTAYCLELGCEWEQSPSEKTYVNYRARSHRQKHRSDASRPCAATAPGGITCWRLKGHEGMHCGNTLDESGRFTTDRYEWSDEADRA